MPFETRFDPETGILFAVVLDDFTLEEFEQGLQDLAGSAEVPASVPTLWDMTRLDFHLMDNNRLEHMLEIRLRYPERGRARLALLVDSPLQYGVSRMYEMLSESRGLPQSIQVFYERQQAVDWLAGA